MSPLGDVKYLICARHNYKNNINDTSSSSSFVVCRGDYLTRQDRRKERSPASGN